jgi:hypothetical protein
MEDDRIADWQRKADRLFYAPRQNVWSRRAGELSSSYYRRNAKSGVCGLCLSQRESDEQ